jgi:hypothetical protein
MDNQCKKRGCRCLRYRSKKDKDECVFCDHSIGFHEFSPININEHPYGRCNELDCDCQRYKEETLYKCIYCGHPEGFHHRWEYNNIQSTTIVVPSSTITTQITSLPHSRGRPKADKVIINYLICFDKASSNKIPKKGTTSWLNLKNKNLIKENIEISQTTPEELYNIIFNLFGKELNGQEWILYSASSGQPTRVTGVSNKLCYFELFNFIKIINIKILFLGNYF